jgi:hypothetical protein
METTSLKFRLSANGTGTCFSLRIDGKTVWQGDPGSADQPIEYNLSDTDGERHLIEFVLEGKTFDHITQKRLTDEKVNKCRAIYFAN